MEMPLLTSYIYDRLPDDLQAELVDAFLTSLVDKEHEFPIAGVVAQEWLGYAQKQTLKRLYTYHLEISVDYIVQEQSRKVFISGPKNPAGGRPTEDVRFTVDAFKCQNYRFYDNDSRSQF